MTEDDTTALLFLVILSFPLPTIDVILFLDDESVRGKGTSVGRREVDVDSIIVGENDDESKTEGFDVRKLGIEVDV